MGQITGGRILFGDAIKHNPADQYSLSRKAEAEFSFAGAEGEAIEGVCEQAIALARAKVAEMLSGKKVTTVIVETAASPGDQAKAAVAKEMGTEPAKTPRKPRTPPATAADDMAEVDTAKPAEAAAELAKTAAPVDDMDDGLFDSGPAQVTDAELLDKIKAKNGELISKGMKTGSVPMIKALIATMFRPEELPKQSIEIPMPLRPDFLKKLAALVVPT